MAMTPPDEAPVTSSSLRGAVSVVGVFDARPEANAYSPPHKPNLLR
jgi:hypothetical protein